MIKKAFDANGIKFAFPTVQIAGDGELSTAAVAHRALELTQPAAENWEKRTGEFSCSVVKSVFGAKSGEGADVHLVRAGTGLRRCRVAEGFGVTDPAQTDGTPARSAAPLAGPIRGRFE